MSITLQVLEQAVARRCGPYRSAKADAQVPGTATTTVCYVPALRSNIDLDSVTNLWILRRSASSFDRQRQVETYDATTGGIYPDAPWQVPPTPGEALEFHHLDPDQELRPAVLAGLARCFSPDVVQVAPTSYFTIIDLTTQAFWIADPWQVARVQYGTIEPWSDCPYEVTNTGGSCVISNVTGFPQAVWVTAWRPSSSWVNGADSTTGPVADTDVLDVDPGYAAAAGHIEAWHLFPSRMVSAAAGGYQATQAMAAQEFTRQAAIFGPQRNITIGLSTVVGHGLRSYAL